MYIYIYIYIYTHVCTYVYMYVSMYVCKYKLYACTCVLYSGLFSREKAHSTNHQGHLVINVFSKYFKGKIFVNGY